MGTILKIYEKKLEPKSLFLISCSLNIKHQYYSKYYRKLKLTKQCTVAALWRKGRSLSFVRSPILHFMKKKISTVSGKKLAFSSFLVEKNVYVNYGTFSVYVFPKFNEKNCKIWMKTEQEIFFKIILILLRLQPLFHCALDRGLI